MTFTHLCQTSQLKDHFLPYQRDWIEDQSRFKIGLWARQTGKDYTSAAEAIFDCHNNPGATWLIVAAGERQALESLRKAKDWAGAAHTPITKSQEYRDTPNSV